MDLVRKWRRTPPAERFFLLQAGVALLLFQLALRCLPFRWLYSYTQRFGQNRLAHGDDDTLLLGQVVRAVERAGDRLLGEDSCLPRALAAQLLLRRGGIPAELCIGVRRGAAGKLEAHAWVESRGVVVIGEKGADLESYVELPNPAAFTR
jgi:hypothetical protein